MTKIRINWIDDYPLLGQPSAFVRMRRAVANYIRKDKRFSLSFNARLGKHDLTVFIKNPLVHTAEKLDWHSVIWDTNVNYLENWGTYDIPGTKPTKLQEAVAVRMAMGSARVICASSYLRAVFNRIIGERAVFVPDAVDTKLYSPEGYKAPGFPVRLIWSGIGKKAKHLELIEDLLIRFKDKLQLWIVTSKPAPNDVPAPVIKRLRNKAGAEVFYYDYKEYVSQLLDCHYIISPKILNNAYEMAHSEHKITLGMACGLPAIASPQLSYEEALSNGGGWICWDAKDWDNLFKEITSPHFNGYYDLSLKARKAVVDRYSIPVIGEMYKKVLRGSI